MSSPSFSGGKEGITRVGPFLVKTYSFILIRVNGRVVVPHLDSPLCKIETPRWSRTVRNLTPRAYALRFSSSESSESTDPTLSEGNGRVAKTASPTAYHVDHGGMIDSRYLHGVAGPRGRSIRAGSLVVQE